MILASSSAVAKLLSNSRDDLADRKRNKATHERTSEHIHTFRQAMVYRYAKCAQHPFALSYSFSLVDIFSSTPLPLPSYPYPSLLFLRQLHLNEIKEEEEEEEEESNPFPLVVVVKVSIDWIVYD